MQRIDDPALEAEPETVTVIRATRGDPAQAPARVSFAEAKLAELLDRAEEQLRAGRDLIAEGLEALAIVERPQHPNLETLIAQVIEQVIEYRRVHR